MKKKYFIYTQQVYLLLIYSLIILLDVRNTQAQTLQSAPNSVSAVEMSVPKTLPRSQLSKRLKQILADGEKLTVSQVTEAILQLIVQDISHLKVNLVNPLVIRGVIPQSPLAPAMSSWAESRLSSIIHQNSSIKLRECISCKRQITSIDDQRLVFMYGNLQSKGVLTKKDDTDFQSALDITLSWSASRMVLIAHARLLSPQGKLLWHESYRSGDFGATAKRGIGEQQEETSIAKYRKLAKVDSSPILDLKEITLGYGLRVGQGKNNLVARLGGGYGVFFGSNDEHLLMLQAIVSFNEQVFSDFNLEYRKRIQQPESSSTDSRTKSTFKQRVQQASQGLWLKAMLGIPFSPLIAGNSIGFGLQYMSRYRIGLAGNLLYAFNFDEREGPPPGGIGIDLSMVINF